MSTRARRHDPHLDQHRHGVAPGLGVVHGRSQSTRRALGEHPTTATDGAWLCGVSAGGAGCGFGGPVGLVGTGRGPARRINVSPTSGRQGLSSRAQKPALGKLVCLRGGRGGRVGACEPANADSGPRCRAAASGFPWLPRPRRSSWPDMAHLPQGVGGDLPSSASGGDGNDLPTTHPPLPQGVTAMTYPLPALLCLRG